MASLSDLSFVRFIHRSEKKAKSTQTQKLVVNHMLPIAHVERTSVILYVSIQWCFHRESFYCKIRMGNGSGANSVMSSNR
jgi:hypothetical protein